LGQLRELSARLVEVRLKGYGDEASRLDVDCRDDGLLVHCLLNEDAEEEPREGEKIFAEVFRRLASPQIAPWLATLTFEGLQIACNGTIDWEVEPIAYAESPFSRLKIFRLESIGAADEPYFAGTLSGRDHRDTSVATRFLERMPILEELAIPEPPKEEAFYHGPPHPLKRLSVFDADDDLFILRLSQSRRFSRLEEVRFVESFRADVSHRLPCSHYSKLFKSAALPALRAATIEQVGLSDDQAQSLRETPVGRKLSRFTVKPARAWCDRPILHAPEDFGLPAPPRPGGPDDDCAYLVGELKVRFLRPLGAAAADFRTAFPDVRTKAWCRPRRDSCSWRSLAVVLACVVPGPSPSQSNEVKLVLCFEDLSPHHPTVEVQINWGQSGTVEADLFSGATKMTENALGRLTAELPQLLQILRNAVQRGKPQS
jgi:hypothetical protein